MTTKSLPFELTKRENQIMAVLYRDGASTIADIAREIPNAPTDTALRRLLRILEDKGCVSCSKNERKNVYTPTVNKAIAAMPALHHVLETFFGGSLSGAVAAHLADPSSKLDKSELERLIALVGQSDKGGQ